MEREVINNYFKNKILELVTLVPDIKYAFEITDRDDLYYDGFDERIKEELELYNTVFSFGISRLVFIFNDYTNEEISSNYVVKIPYGKTDYSAREVEKYEEIELNYKDYKDYFCETWFGGFLEDIEFVDGEIPFYIMERADEDEDAVYSSSIKNLEEDDDYYDYECDEHVEMCLADFYDAKVAKILMELLSDLGINDMHERNIGFSHGEIKFIDYAGF